MSEDITNQLWNLAHATAGCNRLSMREIKIEKSFTKRDHDSLRRYLNDIAGYPLLSAEEEVMLGRKIQGGDLAALQRLVNSNLRFVVSVAKKYEGQGLPLADLISEGNAGLVKAAERFDESRGFKFISFAVWWIRQSMMMAIGTYKRMIRLPMNQVNDIQDLWRSEMEMEQKLERLPTDEELADFTGIPLDRLKAYQYSPGHTVSLDNQNDEEDKPGIMTFLEDTSIDAPDATLQSQDLTYNLRQLLNQLPDRQRRVIQLSFGLQGNEAMHLEDIADLFELSKESVRKIKYQALHNLGKEEGVRRLRQYL